ncbi:tRNA 2-thiouridine(34) synthase MnmA [Candidatus Pacearchaeota archaeon]|nr:tRNA 2-thiouridine(34) synthase MnmA [Candidatus Pacearchaeota archaeon]MBI2057089.1 tRNA 2-thiouridine(34) synthase MnmA [Candidatus Pacearchaeota archaeon]
MKKTKVLLAMSGGVDSSVAALLLKKQGYEVIGAFMINWSDTKNKLTGECAWRDERRIAMKIAAKLGIKFITLNFEKEYKKEVVDVMFKNYQKGITPNPDIDCNNKIKFPLLIKKAKELGCDFIATGHYARIKKITLSKKAGKQSWAGEGGAERWRVGRIIYELLRAKDELKDQSYFLYRIKQNELKNILFPIGNYTKKEIREIAKKNKFPNYNKKGTVGICFIGKINLKEFLKKRIKPKKGVILDPNGNKIGEHDGIYYYTIGQRIGSRFGIEIKKPEIYQKKWYVARKIPKTNTIIAAPEGHGLNFRKEIIIKNPYWINPDFADKLKTDYIRAGKQFCETNLSNQKQSRPEVRESENGRWKGERSAGGRGNDAIKVYSRIRQVGELLSSKLEYKNKKLKIILKKAITGVSQGQAIVLYRGAKCLGGGVIYFN